MSKNISVVHIGTEISHSSAPLRIHEAVKTAGIDSRILTLRSKVDNSDIEICEKKLHYKIKNKIYSEKEKHELQNYPNKMNVPFSFGAMGLDVSKMDIVQRADILHLHWINGQFLAYQDIAKLGKLGKPIVWTFHDSWPMTGGCHVRYGCMGFAKQCGNCPELSSAEQCDISNRIIKNKKKYYPIAGITTVAPSRWMDENIRKSYLFSESKHAQIGNPLDLDIFKPTSITQKKNDKIVILFGANGVMDLEYKGYQYFVEAMSYLKKKYSILGEKIQIDIFGTEITNYPGLEAYKCKALGYIKSDEEMAEAYSNADIYAFPSLDDNLPGTVMECLACKTPVVCFNTCGIPEMVQHKINGYVAEFKNAHDFAEGIMWVMQNNHNNCLGSNGRNYILENFNLKKIGEKYKELYNMLM